MKRRFLVGAGLAIGVAVVAGGEYLVISREETPVPVAGSVGGAFTLERDDGTAFTEKNLLGKPALIYFGYTFCPDVCPTTLAHIGAWLKALGPQAADIRAVFVTIDPARDTGAQMRQYLAAFDPRIIGLTGTPAEIATIAKAYKVYYRKVPGKDGNYAMEHSSYIYLMNAKGALAGLIGEDEPQAQALAAIRTVLKQNA